MSFVPSTDVPRTAGGLNLDTLSAALERAGRAAPSGPLGTEALTGGRTGAQVLRVTTGDGRSFVAKRIPAESWRTQALGQPNGGEGALFHAGALQDVPPIHAPFLDAAFDDAERVWWVLMDDVGAGIRPRGRFSHDDTEHLFACLARFHARHYQSDRLETWPMPHVAGPLKLFAEPVLQLAGFRDSPHPWVSGMLADFKVIGAFMPSYMDVLGPLGDDFVALVADETWKDELTKLPATMVHGDLRRANISFGDDGGVTLFDWEFAARGPAATDLQWHCFLHYWAYPPDCVVGGDPCDDLKGHYLREFEAALGRSIDHAQFERAWGLGWLKVMAQLSYTLIDPLYPDGGTPEQRQETRRLVHAAVRRALDIRERL